MFWTGKRLTSITCSISCTHFPSKLQSSFPPRQSLSFKTISDGVTEHVSTDNIEDKYEDED